MRKLIQLHQPHMKAKLLGIILMSTGLIFLMIPQSLFLKFGFSCILIGLFMIVMITERTVSEMISNVQIQGHANAFQKIANQLNLKGNAMFLPKSDIRNEERIFIPLKKSKPIVPSIDNDLVFATGADGTSIGIALPPSGIPLLSEIEKETRFENTDMDHLEEKLQTFVGMNITTSIALKQKNNRWQLELEKPLYCSHMSSLCTQYPCPTCSAILTAITKATDTKIQIDDAYQNGKRTTFYFTMIRD